MLKKNLRFPINCRFLSLTKKSTSLGIAATLTQLEQKKMHVEDATKNVYPSKKLNKKSLKNYYDEFPIAYPDFLSSPVWNRRDPLFEELTYADMMERRTVLDIPEFYVGSIMAVTCSDKNLGNHQNRFVGICVSRHKSALHHRFTLRNIIDGLGVEVMYEIYNPTIIKIETIKLEKRLDEDLSYLIDALPEYSTFDFNMEPVAHPIGTPVPVKLRPPPWSMRWEMFDLKGIEDSWTQATPYYKRKLAHVTKVQYFKKFDLIRKYREDCQELEHDIKVQDLMREFEAHQLRIGGTKRKILRSASQKIEGSL